MFVSECCQGQPFGPGLLGASPVAAAGFNRCCGMDSSGAASPGADYLLQAILLLLAGLMLGEPAAGGPQTVPFARGGGGLTGGAPAAASGGQGGGVGGASFQDSSAPGERISMGPGKPPAVRRQGKLIGAEIADNFDAMVEAAKKDGVELKITSGYRTYAEQQALYAKYGSGRAAKPGTSNHESGRAIDFANTSGAYAWLKQNAARFGLYNKIASEPWHYSTTGT
ncbi:MAG: M15 family metallopeptidase [Armatimonadetes bacterium]|nr:M15 family metallopeptidase [Armatimonadota bacterium]